MRTYSVGIFRNYSDDDVLLDTGVSFSLSHFAKARIVGEELRLLRPLAGAVFSGYLSYANQSGIGQGAQ